MVHGDFDCDGYMLMILLQSLIPVVMSGIIAVYSLVIAVLISSDMGPPPNSSYSLFKYAYMKWSHYRGQADVVSVVSCILHAVSRWD